MDVPKTPVSLLGRRTRAGDASRIRAYLKEFINAKEEKNNRTERWKRDYAKTLMKNLNKLIAFQCQQLFNDIQMDSTLTNKAVFWKDVPHAIKDRHKTRLEVIAERVHIRITECIDHWVADACLRKYYERNYNSLAKKVWMKCRLLSNLIFFYSIMKTNKRQVTSKIPKKKRSKKQKKQKRK